MSRPEDLRQAAENTLYGLKADDALKFRILQKAAVSSVKPQRSLNRTFPVLCTVLAALLIAVVALNSLQAIPSGGPGEINVFAAGMTDSGNGMFPADFDPASVISITLEDSEPVTSPEQCSALAGILLDHAQPAESSDPSDQLTVLIASKDGLSYSFFANDPYLSDANGHCWYCPAFFTELNHISQ